MTSIEIARHRLHNQLISQSLLQTPAEVLTWMGAMQAQDYPGVKWSIGLRLAGATDADIERAIVERSIVRTWPLRGTLHVVAASDVRWMLALTAPRTLARFAPRHRQLELDEATFAESNAVLERVLRDGKQLTREEIAAALQESGIATDGQRLAYMLLRAALDGLICFGARRGKQFTYTLLEEWIPPAQPKVHDEALADLARRYFTSRGPATVQDFAWWSGLTLSDARAGLEAVKQELVEEKVDGTTYWLPDRVPSGRDSQPSVYLLPGFDEYMLGYTDRSAVLDDRYARLVPKNGMFSPTVVVDGYVEGTWQRTFKKGGVAIDAVPFTEWSADEQRGLAAAASRFAAYLEMPVV